MSERIAPRATGGRARPRDDARPDRHRVSAVAHRADPGDPVNAATEHKANADAGTSSRTVVRVTKRPGKSPRRARLRLTRIDPWCVMKTSFLLSVAFGVVTFVAVFMVWSVLGAAGVWDSINSTVASVVEGDQPSDFDVTNYVGMGRVLGFTLLVSIIDVILLTAIATLTAFLYNMAAALLGGIEVTLAEDERLTFCGVAQAWGSVPPRSPRAATPSSCGTGPIAQTVRALP